MKVPVIDNGGQWTHREFRVLRDLGVDTEIVPNTTRVSPGSVDGVVLSGGALSLEGVEAPLGVVGEWIDGFDGAVLGICVGHQFLGRHFGGAVSHAPAPEFGRVAVEVDRPEHPIFDGLPAHLTVWSSHNDQVSQLPPAWLPLAHSSSCPVQAMAHPNRPIVGLQFHPEVEHTVGGLAMFQNFLKLCHR